MANSIYNIVQQAILKLQQNNITSAHLDAQLLLAFILDADRLYLYQHKDKMLSNKQLLQYDDLISRRAKCEPLAYIIGYKEFYGEKFIVNKQVLIPRPETERIVDKALEIIKNKNNPLIVDACTGSGRIGISIALHKADCQIIATDICPKALKVAKQNAKRLNVDGQIKFIQGNLLDNLVSDFASESIDLIVSNPPYINNEQMPNLMADVIDYEPHGALLGIDDDGLGHHKILLNQASHLLKKNSSILLEIDGSQRDKINNIKIGTMKKSKIINDLANIPRVAIFKKL